jgi:hypothetical protein
VLNNWQTSLIGILALVVGGALLYFGKITWEQFLTFLAIGGIGLRAKDFNVTGGSIPQASPPGVAIKSDALGVIAAVNALPLKSFADERAKVAAQSVVSAPMVSPADVKLCK